MRLSSPEVWQDGSLLILKAGQVGPSGVTPTFVITREPVPDDLVGDRIERLGTFIGRQLEKMRNSLPHFRELSRRSPSAEHPTAELSFTWMSDQTALAQSIIYAFAGDDMLISSTATAGEAEFADLQPTFRRMLKSFRTG